MSLIDFLVNVELDTPRPDYRALLIAARNVTSPVAETPAAPSAFQPHVAAWRTAWQNAGLDPALFDLGAQPSDAPVVALGNAVARRFELPVTAFALDGFAGLVRIEVGTATVRHAAGSAARRFRPEHRVQPTPETTSVLYILEALDPLTDDDLRLAADDILDALRAANPDVEVAQRILRPE